ncbi:MAG: hypothetical protein Kow0040_02020 [Thermogutta sp.]
MTATANSQPAQAGRASADSAKHAGIAVSKHTVHIHTTAQRALATSPRLARYAPASFPNVPPDPPPSLEPLSALEPPA